ncbi:hypothetical protein G7059_07875 [Erysipelothrix sp. HDW6A]|uniref:hypothetical protein n=1 Tax=Erysipelothrix sp. HDW6A TaxID=2714928 RepID=UPI0014078321|nr:hypothetical protein [Erysipelothrix sp. HDW6A]QIK57761.1 hypothetical protein G7059_07875 [Erysipelothrix sp. HDW6A]
MSTTELLAERKAELKEEQAKYDYRSDETEINRLNDQLQNKVILMNQKKNLYDEFEKEIVHIEDMERYLETLETEEVEEVL